MSEDYRICRICDARHLTRRCWVRRVFRRVVTCDHPEQNRIVYARFENLGHPVVVRRLLTSFALLLAIPFCALADSTTSTREFLDGHRSTFSTKDHPKAKGVNFTIAYPSTWAAAEGERPNIVQKFVSEGGRGLEVAMIITKHLPIPPGTVVTEQDQRDQFSSSELRAMLPPGATFVDAQPTQIEAIPAGILEYKMRVERAGMAFMIHAWTLIFLSGNTLVYVQFQVGELDGSDGDVSRRMDAFKPLFFLMANSIVFPDKWTTAAQAPTDSISPPPSWSSLPFDDPPLLVLTLFVSFIGTWSLGLTPPLLIRYAFMRRPLSRKASSWIAAGFSAFLWIAFLALHHPLGEKPGNGAVWVIMFFVARWIMSRGYVSPSSTPDESAL